MTQLWPYWAFCFYQYFSMHKYMYSVIKTYGAVFVLLPMPIIIFKNIMILLYVLLFYVCIFQKKKELKKTYLTADIVHEWSSFMVLLPLRKWTFSDRKITMVLWVSIIKFLIVYFGQSVCSKFFSCLSQFTLENGTIFSFIYSA